MLFSLESKNYNKLMKDSLINWKFQKEVFLLINMFSLNLWKTMVIWIKHNLRFSNHYTAVLKLWHLNRKQKLFIWDVHLKNVLKEQKLDQDQNKILFHFNIWIRFILNIKIGSIIMILKESWFLILVKILRMIKIKLLLWLKN